MNYFKRLFWYVFFYREVCGNHFSRFLCYLEMIDITTVLAAYRIFRHVNPVRMCVFFDTVQGSFSLSVYPFSVEQNVVDGVTEVKCDISVTYECGIVSHQDVSVFLLLRIV